MIGTDTVVAGNIATGAVGPAELAADAVETTEIKDAAVTAAKIAADAVETAKIKDANVTAGKLASTLDLSAKTLTLSAAQKAVDYIEIRDEKAANTAGGSAASGAWRTRDLNTEHSDAGNHASVASNQITLAAGTYIADISAPACICAAHQARLYNITDSATTLVGESNYTGTGNTNISYSRITGRFTIAAQTVFEVQHRVGTTRNTDGFGIAVNFGEVEVYTVARFWKVA